MISANPYLFTWLFQRAQILRNLQNAQDVVSAAAWSRGREMSVGVRDSDSVTRA